PHVSGTPAVGASSCWQLDERDQKWLRRNHKVIDATKALQAEDEGMRRRNAPPHDKIIPRWAISTTQDEDGHDMALWLGRPKDESVAVLVDGVKVQELQALRVPGLNGWLDGSFATDVAFTKAKFSREIVARLTAMAAHLLEQEARQNRSALFKRLFRANSAKLNNLVREGSPWFDLALFTDVHHNPLTLGMLVALRRKKNTFLIGHLDDTPAASPVIAVYGERESELAKLFPKVKLRHWEEVSQRQQLHQQKEEQRRLSRAVIKKARSWTAEQWHSLILTKAKHWEQSDFPSFLLQAEPDSPQIAIAAWKLILECRLSTEEELSVIGKLAKELAGEMLKERT
ncbi:MAG: hypothetical protein HN348_04295, partial [Proteobacteria bacterium]|nr:hypothetical protein [Pseudomonadota bacterium]